MPSREYFAQVAGNWDQLRAGFFSVAVREAALKLAGLREGHCTGHTAADLGAGTGFVTGALLQAGLSVAAVDQPPQMLAELRATFGPGRPGGGRVSPHEGRDSGREPLDRAYAPVQVFRDFFLERFGSDQCTDICGCRLDTDEGRKAFVDCGLRPLCQGVAVEAAAPVARLLAEHQAGSGAMPQAAFQAG